MKCTYSAEENAFIRRCIAERKSSPQIAAMLTHKFPSKPPRTKNAIIGYCHRNGLTLLKKLPVEKVKKPKQTEFVMAETVKMLVEKPIPIPAQPSTEYRPMLLAHAGLNNCLFIEGDARQMMVCGSRTKDGISWCSDHARRCFTSRAA